MDNLLPEWNRSLSSSILRGFNVLSIRTVRSIGHSTLIYGLMSGTLTRIDLMIAPSSNGMYMVDI